MEADQMVQQGVSYPQTHLMVTESPKQLQASWRTRRWPPRLTLLSLR